MSTVGSTATTTTTTATISPVPRAVPNANALSTAVVKASTTPNVATPPTPPQGRPIFIVVAIVISFIAIAISYFVFYPKKEEDAFKSKETTSKMLEQKSQKLIEGFIVKVVKNQQNALQYSSPIFNQVNGQSTAYLCNWAAKYISRTEWSDRNDISSNCRLTFTWADDSRNALKMDFTCPSPIIVGSYLYLVCLIADVPDSIVSVMRNAILGGSQIYVDTSEYRKMDTWYEWPKIGIHDDGKDKDGNQLYSLYVLFESRRDGEMTNLKNGLSYTFIIPNLFGLSPDPSDPITKRELNIASKYYITPGDDSE